MPCSSSYAEISLVVALTIIYQFRTFLYQGPTSSQHFGYLFSFVFFTFKFLDGLNHASVPAVGVVPVQYLLRNGSRTCEAVRASHRSGALVSSVRCTPAHRH